MMLSSQVISAQRSEAATSRSGGNASQGQSQATSASSRAQSSGATTSRSSSATSTHGQGQRSSNAQPVQQGTARRNMQGGTYEYTYTYVEPQQVEYTYTYEEPQQVEYTYTYEEPEQMDYTFTEISGDKAFFGEQQYNAEPTQPTVFEANTQKATVQKTQTASTQSSAQAAAQATVTPAPQPAQPKPAAPAAQPVQPKPEPPKPEPPKAEPQRPTQPDPSLLVTHEDKVNIPQIKYITLDQIKSGTFEWPIVRRASVSQGITTEKTVSIPQIGFLDLCIEHPTVEHQVSLVTVHTTTIQQIVPTNECDVELIQVHTVWIPVMGDINIVQHSTKSRRVHLKQEWDCSIKCEDTRIHFLQLPQQDTGIKGTVVVSGNQDDSKSCYNCNTSKCSGVGPALLPVFMDEVTPVSRPAPAQAAPPPKPEIKIVEVVKEVCTHSPEPTEIHHVTLGMCPCKDQAIAAPLNFAENAGAFAEQSAYAGAFKWWMLPLILLGLLLLSMLLAWLLCFHRRKTEKVQVEKKPESPQKKFIIEKKTKEEDEEEIEREIARTLQARVDANKREQVSRAPEPAPVAVIREEEKKVEAQAQAQVQALAQSQAQAQAQVQAARQEVASAVQENKNKVLQESPGGSQNSDGRQRSSRGSGSSKKVVKKRIVKMMKQGKLVAEKEEILDEEGNVIRTEIRKEGLSSGSPNRSQS